MSATTTTEAPSRRERQRRETRERVFDAAISVISRHGLEATDVREVAERAGVVRGTVYYHFPTLRHVTDELQRREEARMADSLRASTSADDDLGTRLHRVTDELLDSERRLGPQLFRDMLSGNFGRAVRPVDHVPTNPVLEFVVEAAADAGERRELRPDTEPITVAAIALIGVFGALAAAPEPSAVRNELVGQVIDLVVRGASRPEEVSP